MERFAEERANLEASVSEKRANLEHAFEEKERRFMSTCESSCSQSGRGSSKLLLVAAQSERAHSKIEEVNEGKNDSDAVVTASHIITAQRQRQLR